MNELMKFEYAGVGFPCFVEREEFWFYGKATCDILELGNSRQAISRLDDDEKGVISKDTPGGVQNVQIVNESGLYTLILSSRKSAAKKFKRWVTHEVLPAIRRTGEYSLRQKSEELEAVQRKYIAVLEEVKKFQASEILRLQTAPARRRRFTAAETETVVKLGRPPESIRTVMHRERHKQAV